VVEQLAKHWGTERVAIGPELSFADGIEAGRWLLQQPMRIHPRCADGIEALRQYHYGWDEDRKVLSRLPEHDWSSHTADAFRYLAQVVKHSGLIVPKKRPEKPTYVLPVRPTIDQLFESMPKPSGRI
jgi:hypothetical protein